MICLEVTCVQFAWDGFSALVWRQVPLRVELHHRKPKDDGTTTRTWRDSVTENMKHRIAAENHLGGPGRHTCLAAALEIP